MTHRHPSCSFPTESSSELDDLYNKVTIQIGDTIHVAPESTDGILLGDWLHEHGQESQRLHDLMDSLYSVAHWQAETIKTSNTAFNQLEGTSRLIIFHEVYKRAPDSFQSQWREYRHFYHPITASTKMREGQSITRVLFTKPDTSVSLFDILVRFYYDKRYDWRYLHVTLTSDETMHVPFSINVLE